ncbi:MAG: DMT family transporter, partial [Bdellovibrionaceae bacterium]|nr:DMT family transporter [Pseudobdellovibrionaceae bacterium]
FAVIACAGAYLLMGLNVAALSDQVNPGDLWTLASAVLAAFHIIYIGRVTKTVKNPFRLNNFQSLWALIVILPIFLWSTEFQRGAVTSKALIGVFILASACSVLAFFIQVRAQKVLSDTTASMIFLLESPYAFFFAYLLLDDTLTIQQAMGAVLIVTSAVATVLFEQRGLKRKRLV